MKLFLKAFGFGLITELVLLLVALCHPSASAAVGVLHAPSFAALLYCLMALYPYVRGNIIPEAVIFSPVFSILIWTMLWLLVLVVVQDRPRGGDAS
jgi:hypothetical protein